MGYFLIKLRRRSVLKLRNLWENRLGTRSRIVPIAMLIGVAGAVAAAVLHELVALLEKGGACLRSSDSPALKILFLILPLFLSTVTPGKLPTC